MGLGKEDINRRVRNLEVSSTLAINERSDELIAQGKTVYKLGLGQSPFPVPEVVVKELQHHAGEKDYLPVTGLPELQEAVADFHRLKDKIEAEPENVLIGPGSKELMFLLQLVFDGDIILPTPCWVSYGPQSRILGRDLHFLHTRFDNGWKLTPSLLQEFLEEEERGGENVNPKLLIFNYPSNPDGTTYSNEELQEIAEIAREYNLLILSDEIYGLLHHQGEHISIARFYPEGTIISSGLSKWCGAGGWRLGTFTFPGQLDWLRHAMSIVASETYTSVSSPIQHAAIRAFRGGTSIDLYLMHARRILSTLGKECANKLENAGVNVRPPVGGFYLFLDFTPLRERLKKRNIKTSPELSEQLLEETGVALLPGSAFERPEQELTLRMAYVDFNGEDALKASYEVPLHERLPSDFTRNYCNKVLQAIDHLAGWIGTE